MPNTVENLMQAKQSILHQTATSRNEEFSTSFTPKDYTFEEFLEFMEIVKPRYFRISTRKQGINIVFGITKKKAYFGRAENFSDAFRKLISDIDLVA